MYRNQRRNQNGRGRKEKNPDGYLIKLFFQLIQALHHLGIIKPQASGQIRTKGFEKQVQMMDRFLKPAQSNEKLRKELEEVHREWATNVAKTLADHYQDRISELMGRIVGWNLPEWTVNNLSNQALGWAKDNFRKKLRVETISRYKAIVKSIIPGQHQQPNQITDRSAAEGKPDTERTMNAYTSPRKTTPRKYPIEPNVISLSNRFQPLQILDTEPPRTPSKRRRISDSNIREERAAPKRYKAQYPSTISAKKTEVVATCKSGPVQPIRKMIKCLSIPSITNLGAVVRSRSPSPTRNDSPARNSLSPQSRSGSTSPIIPLQTYSAALQSTRKLGSVNRHKEKKSMWAIPQVHCPTLIIGDSQLARITNTADKPVQIESYPGAKIAHLLDLVKNHKHDGKPKRMLLNVGINERANLDTNRVFLSMKELVTATRENFPDTDIYVAQIPVSDLLRLKRPVEARNIARLNENLARTGAKLLKTGDRQGIAYQTDGIHWGPRSANEILDSWMKQMEQDFHSAQKTPHNM